MAGLDLETMVRREGNDVWIKVTPGRLDTFLAYYIRKTDMAGRNVGTAQRFLALLEHVAGQQLTNPKVLTTCDVYVITSAEAVKIGISNNGARRVSDLQIGVGAEELRVHKTWTLPNAKTARQVEKAAHTALKDKRIRGEWFAVSPDQAAACVAAIIAEHAPCDTL